MAYKNGTYVAFDGCGTTDPTDGDIKYYELLRSWEENIKVKFSFSDSHQTTYSVRDSSSIERTLKPRLRERMSNSKNMLLILSKDTSNDCELLNYEIEIAVDYYKIPLIVAYPGIDNILLDAKGWYIINFDSRRRREVNVEHLWPNALSERIQNKSARCIHIPFKKDAIQYSIDNFSCHKNNLNSPVRTFNENMYNIWYYYK